MQRRKVSHSELELRLRQSEKDKKELQKSIQQLNECYQIKIAILQATIDQYGDRIEQVLKCRKDQVDKQVTSSQKHQQENLKLMGIIDELRKIHEQQIKKSQQQLKIKNDMIIKIEGQKNQLLSKSQDSQLKIDQLVREHTKQIEQLKKQLVILKQEIIESGQDSTLNKDLKQFNKIFQNIKDENSFNYGNHPLKQISNNQSLNIVKKQNNAKHICYKSPLDLYSKQ